MSIDGGVGITGKKKWNLIIENKQHDHDLAKTFMHGYEKMMYSFCTG